MCMSHTHKIALSNHKTFPVIASRNASTQSLSLCLLFLKLGVAFQPFNWQSINKFISAECETAQPNQSSNPNTNTMT